MSKKKKLVRRARKAKKIRQIAAVPCRLTAKGRPEVMLVTSRGTQRFIIPKGWPMKGRSHRDVAAIEACEEAGVSGEVLEKPIGTYSYWKRLSDCFVPVEVTVYLVAVRDIADEWKEKQERRRVWLSAEQAATLIDEPELAALLRTADFPALLGASLQ